MKSLRDKIFLIYSIFTLGILGLAGFSYYSSQKLTERIESLTVTDKKSIYIKEISTNITKFTNLYLESPNSLLFSKEHDKILANIRETLQLLRDEYETDETEIIESLDSIPEILDSISSAHNEIRYLNKQYQDDFYTRVEEEILKKITINDLKDAGYVEEKVRSEIVKIIEKDTAIKEAQKNKEKQDTGLLTGIFGADKPKEEPNKVNVEEKVNKAKKEALLSSEIDNLFFSKKVEYIKNEVNKVLYQEQIKAIKIRSKEKQIFNSNIALINKLESIFQKIQREEDKRLREATIETYQASKRFNRILIVIIVGFGISSLAILFFLFKDIERNKYYQSLLRKSEKKALRKALEKQRFLSTMSHELRTPLTSLIGFTELLDRNTKYKRSIQSSANYLWKIVNEIFDLAKLEEGKIEINPENFYMKDIEHDIIENFKEHIENAGLKAIFEFPQENLLVTGDSFRIRQVLYNIIHNAIKFTKVGYISVKIVAIPSNIEDKAKINFEIKDTGVGIAESDFKNIFQDFSQSGTDYDKKKGLGIGLGLVKKIVHAMNGSIALESELGKGSTFKISLELPRPRLDTVEERDGYDEIDEPVVDHLNDIHVLTLEDDPMISKLYSDILSSYGAKVFSENDYENVLRRLNSGEKFDIFITDIKMPKINGLDFLQILKNKGLIPPVCIGVTANIFFNDEYSEKKKLLDAILYKPFTKKQLLKNIQDLLSKDNTSEKSYEYLEERMQNIQNNHEKPKESYTYNLDYLRKLSMDDEDIFNENIELFIQQNIKELEYLKNSLESKEWEVVADWIHKLSGRFAQIQAVTSLDPYKVEKDILYPQTLISQKEDLTLTLLSQWEEINKELIVKFPSSRISASPEELRI